MTSSEQSVGQILKSIGFQVKPYSYRTTIDPLNCFYSQMPFRHMKLDFALPTACLAIEIDGDYWHGSRMLVLTSNQLKRKTDDAAKLILLTKNKWKLLTIVASDIQQPYFKNVLQKRIWGMLDI